MKAILIINPSSGKMKRKMPPILRWTMEKLEKRIASLHKHKTTESDILDGVRQKCDKEGIKLKIAFTKYPKHATKLARDASNKTDLIIVAGGDGTINEVINGMANTKATLVIIPFGSTNVLASELGIPDDPAKAADLITLGKKIKMDLGYAKTQNEAKYFAMMLDVGPSAQVVKDMTPEFKKRWRRLAYPFGIIKLLHSYKWQKIYVRHKTNSVGYFVITANIKYYAGEYEIADKANNRDGLLDLVVINRKNPWDIFALVFSLTIGKLTKYLNKESFQIKEADISSDHVMQIQVDGEILGTTPVSVKIVPKALNVISAEQTLPGINRM